MREEEALQQVRARDGVHHRLVRVELHAGLVVVADLQRFAEVHDAGHLPAHRRVPFPGDEVQEGGLPGGVPADDPHALVPLEIVAEVAQVAFVLPPEGKFLQFPEGLLAVFGLAGAGARGGVHPFQLPPEDVPDLVRLRVVIVDALLPLLQEVHVVAAVDIDLAPVHLHHRVAHAVQEIAVVRDHEQGAAGVLEMLLQELDGVDVQVVRGLVHDVEIGLGGQHLRERHPLDFAAGEVLHRLFPVREGELRQEPLHPALVLPQMVLVQVLRPFGGPVHDLPEDALLGIVGILLLQESDADVLEEQDLPAAVGLVLAGEDPQQGGLPGAVRRDERDLVALVDVEVDVLEQHLGAVRLGNVLDLQVTCHGKTKIRIFRKKRGRPGGRPLNVV